MKKLLLAAFAITSMFAHAQTMIYSYGFDTDFGLDWTKTNQSTPSTTTLWGKATYTLPLTSALFGSGNVNTLPNGQAGGPNSFALVNYTSTSGTGIISNWLITPPINVMDGDIVSIYTRIGAETSNYPDRLELRMSNAATPVIPSGGAADVGSFTVLGASVNPNLTVGGYPNTWTKFQFTVSGVGSTAVSRNFAFRYYVDNGGPSGTNSDLIGIDTFEVVRNVASTSEVAMENNFDIYPNPVIEEINVRSKDKIKSAVVYDMAGKLIPVKFVNNSANVKHLAPGVYQIVLETEQGKMVDRFIKK